MSISAGFRLTQFETYAEMATRADFVPELDITKTAPEMSIGVYFLREYQKCGISGCRTPHQQGVLVRMKDGRETLIGHICGAKKIGLEFESM